MPVLFGVGQFFPQPNTAYLQPVVERVEAGKGRRLIALTIATLITPGFSRLFIRQDRVYTCIKFGRKLPLQVAQFRMQIHIQF